MFDTTRKIATYNHVPAEEMIRKSLTISELPATETFYPIGYLGRNPDLAAIKARNPSFDETSHFENHGKREKREQFTREFYTDRAAFNRHRYEIFREVFSVPVEHPEVANSFPVKTGHNSFELSSYDGESAHGLFAYMRQDLQHNPDLIFMDLGCGFQRIVYTNCLYVEVYPSTTADVVIDAGEPLPFKSNSFDGLSCVAVLEHVRRPWESVKELYRVLKPGGKAYIDWPFLQPYHGYPNHFYNATSDGLRALFEDTSFRDLNIFRHPGQGPDATIGWVLGWFLQGIKDPVIKSRVAGMTVTELLAKKTGSDFMKTVLANFDPKMLNNLACGNCLIATK